MSEKRILLIASLAASLTHFRGDFIKDLIANGYKVYGAAPEMEDEIKERLIALNATPIALNMQRTGLNPFKDIKAIFEIKSIIKKNQINIVFPYTIKPVIYGSIAARMLKVPTFSLITGLGYTFSGMSFKAKSLQKVTQFLYRIGLKRNKVVIFQNVDDYQLFLKKRILKPHRKYEIVSGSGVNLNKYSFREKTNNGEAIRFMFVGRLIYEKGILQLIKAANKIKPIYPKAEFHVFGTVKDSPSAIDPNILNESIKKGDIIYHGKKNNIEDYLKTSDIFILPTFYREGIPRSILEALSIGMPIITTDSPGCRETVLKDENGILITPRNLESLVSSIEFFLKKVANT